MARFTFGGEIATLLVAEDGGNADALVRSPGTALPLYDEPGGTLVDDFLLQDGGGSYTVEATEIEGTATAHLPFFQGPDGATVLYTPADPEDLGGQWLRLAAFDVLDAPTFDAYEDVEALPGYPEVIAAGADEAAARTAIGATTVGDAVFTAASEAAARTAIGIDLASLATEGEVQAAIDAAIPTGVQFQGEILEVGEDFPYLPGAGEVHAWLRYVSDAPDPGTPATPTFVAAAGADGTTSTTTASATIPGTVVEGDFMLAFWTTEASATPFTYTNPSGWTVLDSRTVENVLHSRVLWKVAGPSDAGAAVTGTISGTGARQGMTVVAYRDVDSIDGYAVSTSTASSTTRTTPSYSTTVEDCVTVAAVAGRDTTDITWTSPGSHTERNEQNITGNGGKTCVVSDDLTQVAVSTDVGGDTFTASVATSRTVQWTIALQPSAA